VRHAPPGGSAFPHRDALFYYEPGAAWDAPALNSKALGRAADFWRALRPFGDVALMSALGKAAGQYTSTGVVVLFQNLICFCSSFRPQSKGGWASLRTDKIGLHILRAATGTACRYALFVAMTLMPLTNAILLTFSAPLWMPLIALAVFRQKASTATWIGAAIGFVGVVLVLQPHHQHFNRKAEMAAMTRDELC
jgi:drug/metabolite transporter (DMT)-like permease